MSDSLQPHRRQPTRHPQPWDSPGKNTGVGCHFLLQCMKVKSESEVAQSCLTLHNLRDCSLPGSPVHGIFQARVLEWGAIAFSRSPHKKGKFGHRHMNTERTPWENEGRDWGAFTSQSFHQRLSANHQKLGERYETDLLSKPVDVTNHLDPRLLGTKTARQ